MSSYDEKLAVKVRINNNESFNLPKRESYYQKHLSFKKIFDYKQRIRQDPNKKDSLVTMQDESIKTTGHHCKKFTTPIIMSSTIRLIHSASDINQYQ
jgi:hypothetical protein